MMNEKQKQLQSGIGETAWLSEIPLQETETKQSKSFPLYLPVSACRWSMPGSLKVLLYLPFYCECHS